MSASSDNDIILKLAAFVDLFGGNKNAFRCLRTAFFTIPKSNSVRRRYGEVAIE